MLTIGKLGASPDQLGYYEQQVAQGIEDYFSGRGEAPGRWAGAGSGLVGVRGRVERDGFMRAMEGRDPRTGEQLKPEHGRTKVAAFDLTFSAPKSVSVLFAIADESTASGLLESHERAVEAAFAYIEREACFTRRGRNGVNRVRGDGFLAAAYRHRLSRAGDPQLHTHVVAANMTRAEGRWTSLEAHGLYEHKSAAGALYRAVLRAEVRERLPWVCWRVSGRGLFEIDGVPQPVLREFSRRRVEIEERARELTGVPASSLSRERLQGIALATRKAKEYRVDGARWRQEARARAAEHGLGNRELVQLQSPKAAAASPTEADVAKRTAERLSGPEGLTAQHNTFARRHALSEVAGELTQGARAEQVERVTSSYLAEASVVGLGELDTEQRFTTCDLLACERAIVDGAARRKGERAAPLHPRLADLVLGQAEEPLTVGQATAARTLVADGQGISTLQALAGTGKTRVLAALAQVYAGAGYYVLGVAPTGRAARELGDAAQIPASTIHRLVSDLDESSGFGARSVVLFDEAGTAPTRPSAALFAYAERSQTKVIAVGDSGQLPSVLAGGWFAELTDSLGGPQLRDVIRQRDIAEREALHALHSGDPDEYIELKQDRAELDIHDREADAIEALLADWRQAQQQSGLAGAVMITRDNDTRAILNDRAQRRLIRDGQVARTGITVGNQQFCVGDRVVARRNDRHRNVGNGTLGRVRGVDPRSGAVAVVTDSGEQRVLDAEYVSAHLEHAYALTGHGAHGATVEWAGVIGRPSDFTREWAYTSLSRARGRTGVYLVAEPTTNQREREQYAPPEPQRSTAEALEVMRQAMRRRESELLAVQQLVHADVQVQQRSLSRTLLAETLEASAHQPNPASERPSHRSDATNPLGSRGPLRNQNLVRGSGSERER